MNKELTIFAEIVRKVKDGGYIFVTDRHKEFDISSASIDSNMRISIYTDTGSYFNFDHGRIEPKVVTFTTDDGDEYELHDDTWYCEENKFHIDTNYATKVHNAMYVYSLTEVKFHNMDSEDVCFSTNDLYQMINK